MADETPIDDNAAARQPGRAGPDAHGQAAMLLVESLIHGLISRSTLTVADAVEIVVTAAEVKEDLAAELGDSPETLRRSLALLDALKRSLVMDLAQD